jgi:pilus assembly protein CpaB
MNRQKRTLIVIGVAVLAASAASYGIYRAIATIPVREVEIATRHAVVAATAMPMGTSLTKDNVKVVAWPARTPLADGFADADAVVGRGLIAPVVQNEPLVESKLAPKEAGAGLPPSIPPGMRALSVKVNEVIGVAGFVVPGTRVDVLVVVHQDHDSVSRAVVNNVMVLTAGTRTDQENAKNGKPIPSTVVTLLVSPEDAERIALAESEGQIMLALRNPMDVAPGGTHGVRTAGLLGGSGTSDVSVKPPMKKAQVVHAAPAAPPPPPRAYTVETIRAAKRSEEVVR